MKTTGSSPSGMKAMSPLASKEFKMFQLKICQTSGDASVSRAGQEIGTASFANGAQRSLFQDAVMAGTRPGRAAEISGAIYIPTRD
tara:strand:+ start:312 stop:569 length:258 start_codon:yes stop_codon:yes gene_type:complete